MLRRNAVVHSRGQADASAHGLALHATDHKLRNRPDRINDVRKSAKKGQALRLGANAGKFREARSTAKDAVAAAAQHDDVHRGVMALVANGLGQVSQHRAG